MDRSWAYRPPMRVGDRVNWSVSEQHFSFPAIKADKNSSGKPAVKKFRGTVWWIGRLIELGSGWSAGVEFVSSQMK